MPNIVIIGSGPAGVSASLYTARAGIDTTIITKGAGSLSKAEYIQNYYGIENAITGEELIQSGIKGAKKVGVNFIEEEVVGISFFEKLTVETTKDKYTADGVIIATGSTRTAPVIQGIKEFEGKGVSYCAVCDAFFYKGKDVCVLGTGEYAVHETNALLPVVSSITLLTNGEDVTAQFPEKVKIIKEKIERIEGKERVESVVLADGSSIDTSGIFIAYGVAGSAALAKKIGAQVNGNNIVVDENMATSIPGLFAAGDCTGGFLQVAKAVYEGAKAGTEAIKYIRKNKQCN